MPDPLVWTVRGPVSGTDPHQSVSAKSSLWIPSQVTQSEYNIIKAANGGAWPDGITAPFKSKADAQAWCDKQNKKDTAPAKAAAKDARAAISKVTQAAGIPDVGTILNNLSSANLWIRVAKTVIGGAILIVGIAKMSGASGVAAKAVKAAPFL